MSSVALESQTMKHMSEDGCGDTTAIPLSNVSSGSIMDVDVLSKILKTLPVKSLVRFLSVSKTWNRLITDPLFVNSHLQFNKQSPSPSLSVLAIINIHQAYKRTEYDGKFHYFRIDNTKRTTSEHLEIEFPWKVDKEGVRILGHSNGVVLAVDSQDVYIVSNPITRSFHILPESGIHIPDLTFVDDPRDYWVKDWDYRKLVAIGFGFVDDLAYKVVRVTYGMGRFVRGENDYWIQYRAYEPLFVEVYDSRSLSWRRVLMDPDLSYEHMHGGVYNEVDYNYTKHGNGGVYNSFDGCLYWLAKTTTHDSAIVSFDLVKETMHQTLVGPYKPRRLEDYDEPDHVDGAFGEYGTSLGVQVSGRFVVVLVGDQRNSFMFSVWRMNKEEDRKEVSWTRMYRFVFGGSPKGFSRNGELLLRVDTASEVHRRKIHLYDSKKMDDACFGFTDLGLKLDYIVPDFVESLVLLHKPC